ncbi:MAG TPA: hypothetical protein DCS28_01515 [Candidatus Moranbacteria bacterium]|nr:hypothetical protein [Candidatus Moranbacteria bacterium]HAT74703.1 hypothetical protein [Candidatus Moranbacteria bacterium]
MQSIIFIIYAFFIFCYFLISFFIAYHLIKYAINSHFSHLMVAFFSIISLFLLISNIFLFFSVDWQTILKNIFSNNIGGF